MTVDLIRAGYLTGRDILWLLVEEYKSENGGGYVTSTVLCGIGEV